MANFCSNCGRPLEEGEVCNCTQQTADVQPEVNQETQQATTQQQPAAEPQQAATQQNSQAAGTQTTNKTVEEIKAGFLALLSIVKKPATESKKLAEKSSVVTGVVFMAVKAVVTLIIALIAFHDSFEYISAGSVIFAVLLLTIGVDCAEAAILKAISGAFKVQTDMNHMFTVVGIRAIYETAVIVVVGIFSLISGSFAMIIYVAAAAALPAFQYGVYNENAEGESDKKIYAYMLVKAITAIIAILVIYIFAQSLISGLLGSLMGGFGGYGSFGGFDL
ncbi:MAG: hypothetical protein ACLRZ9_10730 [Eubacterium sp.]